MLCKTFPQFKKPQEAVMKSVTKNQLDEAVIKKLTEAHFPDAKVERIEELTGGMFNVAYHVAGRGLPEESVVLKVGPAPGTKVLTYEKDILAAEVKVYRLLTHRDIPIPKIYASDFTGSVIPANYFFMQRLSGQSWDSVKKNIPSADRPGLMHGLGRYNAAVHDVTGDWFGYIKDDERYRFDSWGAAFFGMVKDILDDGRRDNIKLPYAAVEDAVKKHQSVLNEISTPSLVDFDMWPGNVFVEPQNGHYAITPQDFYRHGAVTYLWLLYQTNQAVGRSR